VGDVDGDGSLDVYLPGSTRDRLLFNDGTGHFLDYTDVRLGPDAASGKSVSLADLDLDGHLDAVVVSAPGRLRVYRNDGTGRPWAGHEALFTPRSRPPCASVCPEDVARSIRAGVAGSSPDLVDHG
jgi:hypothetical protein